MAGAVVFHGRGAAGVGVPELRDLLRDQRRRADRRPQTVLRVDHLSAAAAGGDDARQDLIGCEWWFAQLLLAMLVWSAAIQRTSASGERRSERRFAARRRSAARSSLDGHAAGDDRDPQRAMLRRCANDAEGRNGRRRRQRRLGEHVRLRRRPAARVNGQSLTSPLLDQVDCRYTPHVVGVCVGQPLRIRTSDRDDAQRALLRRSERGTKLRHDRRAGDEKTVTFARARVHPREVRRAPVDDRVRRRVRKPVLRRHRRGRHVRTRESARRASTSSSRGTNDMDDLSRACRSE